MFGKLCAWALHLLAFLKARLNEKSTWAAILLGVTGAAALAAPWSYIAATIGVLGAIVPTSGKAE